MGYVQKRPVLAAKMWRHFKTVPAYDNHEKLNHGKTYPNYFDGWKAQATAFIYNPANREYFIYVVRDTPTHKDREYLWAKLDKSQVYTDDYGYYNTKRFRETGDLQTATPAPAGGLAGCSSMDGLCFERVKKFFKPAEATTQQSAPSCPSCPPAPTCATCPEPTVCPTCTEPDYSSYQTQVDTLTQDKDDLNTKYNDCQGGLETVKATLDSTEAKYAETYTSLQQSQGQYGQCSADLTGCNSSLASAQAQVAALQGQLAQANADLKAALEREGKLKTWYNWYYNGLSNLFIRVNECPQIQMMIKNQWAYVLSKTKPATGVFVAK